MAVAAPSVVVGCRGKGSPQQASVDEADAGLRDLKAFLEAAKAAGWKTSRNEALPVIQALHMVADVSLGRGDVVFLWGGGLSDAPDAAHRILAYQQVIEREGGWALFQDGSLRRITPAEFAAAPRVQP
jgi:hypothetical protein